MIGCAFADQIHAIGYVDHLHLPKTDPFPFESQIPNKIYDDLRYEVLAFEAEDDSITIIIVHFL